ncbi:hypothetical protein [Streptomyces mirabilis]|uniref:hypothetical protein n=1 Tax=Streptomyces mirabilis TaxID=68239 RepID=UPI0033BDF8AB
MTTLPDRRTIAARPKRSAETVELERLPKKAARLKKNLAKRDAVLVAMGKTSASWNC